MGHGDRAKRAGLNLRMQDKACRPGHKCAFAHLLFPRQVMHPVGAQTLHQQVPRGMKAHIVQPGSAGVKAQQFRWIDVGKAAQFQRFCRTQLLADTGEQLGVPVRAFTADRFAQGTIGKKKVAVGEWRRLIKNSVRLPVHNVSLLLWQ